MKTSKEIKQARLDKQLAISAYQVYSPEEKIAYNRKKIEEALALKGVLVKADMGTKAIRELIAEAQIPIGCSLGSDFCIECGLSEIDKYL